MSFWRSTRWDWPRGSRCNLKTKYIRFRIPVICEKHTCWQQNKICAARGWCKGELLCTVIYIYILFIFSFSVIFGKVAKTKLSIWSYIQNVISEFIESFVTSRYSTKPTQNTKPYYWSPIISFRIYIYIYIRKLSFGINCVYLFLTT